jgi:hypothetical protein
MPTALTIIRVQYRYSSILENQILVYLYDHLQVLEEEDINRKEKRAM